MKIPNRNYLNQIVKEYKSGVSGQNNFNSKIRILQKEGFKPLLPILDENDIEMTKKFLILKKERLEKRNAFFGLNQRLPQDYELDLDDDLVADPVLASLLNGDREIIVADSIYKYTELGLLISKKDEKQKIYDFLNTMTPQQRLILANTNSNLSSGTTQDSQKIESVSNGVIMFNVLRGVNQDGSPSGPPPPEPCIDCLPILILQNNPIIGSNNGSVTPQTVPDLNLNNFDNCTIESQGFFEKIFGESEACYDYYSDNRRIKVKFWRQNFFLFSSIGTSSRLQKRECFDFVWSVCWWERSYADKIILGVNSVTYEYNYNVPAYNAAQYNYETKFFEFNGTK